MAEELDVRKILLESQRLPTLPAVATELLSISEWEAVDLAQVARIVSNDVSLVTKILRVVNSPFYGVTRKISTLSQALVVLGLRATRSLILSFSILRATPSKGDSHFSHAKFWTRSLNTAVVARKLAGVAGYQPDEEAFLGGLIQNIGVLVLAQCVPTHYERVLERTEDRLAPTVEAEKAILQTDHVEVAKLLADQWNLPPSLSVPVIFHHTPEQLDRADQHTRDAARIQHLAARLTEWIYVEERDPTLLHKVNGLAFEYFRMSPDELNALMHRVDTRMEEDARLFEITAPRPETYANLLQQANWELGELAYEREFMVKQLEAAKEQAQKLTAHLRSANVQLAGQAHSDALTGLPNRRALEEALQHELDRCVRYGGSLSVLFVDVDDFKIVNDTYGHLEGDVVLSYIANLLRNQVRTSDLVARYGGEEFVVMIVGTEEAGALITAERIRSTMEKTPISIGRDQQPCTITVSIGLVSWSSESTPPHLKLFLDTADRAMYEAKRSGKNCIRRGFLRSSSP